MSSVALALFGFIVLYVLVVIAVAFAADFFRQNGSRSVPDATRKPR